jgi:hypothetical protein
MSENRLNLANGSALVQKKHHNAAGYENRKSRGKAIPWTSNNPNGTRK